MKLKLNLIRLIYINLILLFVSTCFGELERAEKLSNDEIRELQEVEAKAQKQIDDAWSRYYIIDGKYILVYNENHMKDIEIYNQPR